MSKIIKARDKIEDGFLVFLSGSVAGADWRAALMKNLEEENIIFLDPRSDDYASMKMSIKDPKFHDQVTWEQDGLEKASVIVMHFNRNSGAPISLLEFGLFARSERMIVRCPQGYKHKGYVDVLCARFGVEQVDTLEEITLSILERYSKHKKE